MNLLFVDTETTGLPTRWGAHPAELDVWPHIVQLSWILSKDDGEILRRGNYVIRPDGWNIPAESTEVHGMDDETAALVGHTRVEAFDDLNTGVLRDTIFVSHNIKFDWPVICAEHMRISHPTHIHHLRKVCTMEASTDFCNIPGKRGEPKWPRLQELHERLFGNQFHGGHRAGADVEACYRCFFEMVRLQKAGEYKFFYGYIE